MFNIAKNKQSFNQGHLLILVLVFGGIFFVLITSFIGYIITQNQVVNFRYEQQRATEIAEAGLNYYKWYLAHHPDDVTNGTGLPGPYVHQFKDPEGDFIGEFSLDIASTSYCGSVASIDIASTGFTYDKPEAKSTVRARYSRPTVADYSFITNGAVWYGADRVITGPVHSNQGIRMDGYHNSFVGSGQTDWTCTGSFGCSPNATVNGVHTTGSHATPGLFTYPISPVDFAGLTLDLNEMKTRAINNNGRYFGPTSSSFYGYLVTFNPDGTFSVRRVRNNAINYWAFDSTQSWHQDERNVINGTEDVGTYTIDSSCPLLYFEDKVWVEGVINQKVTLAAANLSSSAQTNIVINGNITYTAGTNAGLLAIAEDDVDVGLAVPFNLTANGIFIAQNGRFGRNHYRQDTSYGLPNSLDPFVLRGTLTRFGSVVSNGRVGTQWSSGGTTVSGFANRITSFDQDQVDNPPPLTPETSDVYTLDNWQQDG